jgi:hypothetical protein
MGGVVQSRLVSKWPTKFYLDASLQLPVCKALALVRDDVLYSGGPGCPIAPGDKDRKWVPIVGHEDWIVIMRDKRIRWRPRERQALLDARLRVFLLNRAGNYTRWRVIDLLVRRWAEIESKAEAEPGPYVYSVTHAGLRQIL